MSRAIIYRYPWRVMLPDYVRAVVGMACTFTPLVLMELSGLVRVAMVFLAMIFTLFAAQVVLRHATRVFVSEREIWVRPLGKRLAWDSLTRLKLAYYSVRRDARSGWMELKVQSGTRSLRVDSRLDGFSEVVRQAAATDANAPDCDQPTTYSEATAL